MPWKTLSIPYLSFAAGSAVAQFLLPSTLVPDNGNSRRFITTRLSNLDNAARTRHGDRPQLSGAPPHQLGLHERPVYGLIVIGLALAGAVIACAKSPRINVPLAALMVTTMLVIGTHFRMVSRYYFQVTPLIVLFLTILLVTVRRRSRA